jgi:hypothetical protein
MLTFSVIQMLYAQESGKVKAQVDLIDNNRLSGYFNIKELPSTISLFSSKGDSLVIPVQMISSIKVSLYIEGGTQVKDTKELKHRIRYYNNTFVGILSGKSDDEDYPIASLTAEMINGAILWRYFAPGIGIAYDQYTTTAVLPFFLSIRGDVLDNHFTPFYFFDVGYGAAWDTREADQELDTQGGKMLHMGIGYKMYSDNRINVMIALGYKIQEVTYEYPDWGGGTRVVNRTYKRLSFSLGIGF